MSVAETPRIGHNGGPPLDMEEYRPPKSQRIVRPEDAEIMRVVARMLATRCEIAKWRLTEKRKGGEEGRAVRCVAIGYMRGIGFPVWKLEIMWDLNRKQIGQEEEAYIRIRSDNGFVDTSISHLETMLDASLKLELKDFLEEAAAEIDAIISNRHAAKKARTAEIKSEKENPPPPPAPKAPPTQAERQRDIANAKHRLKALDTQISIAKRVIFVGGQDGSTKEQRQDAKRAVKQLDALLKEQKKTAKVLKANAA